MFDLSSSHWSERTGVWRQLFHSRKNIESRAEANLTSLSLKKSVGVCDVATNMSNRKKL